MDFTAESGPDGNGKELDALHQEELTKPMDSERDAPLRQGRLAQATGPDAGVQLARTLAELIQLSLADGELSDILQRVAMICQDAFVTRVAVSITLGEPASPDLQASDSRLAQQVDGAQVMADEGPCEAAWSEQTTIVAADLHTDGRWPRLHGPLADSPVRSTVAVPMRAGADLIGALNVYSTDGCLTEAPAIATAELLGSSIAAVLREVEVKAQLRGVAEQFQLAMDSRGTIDQAKGILMATHGCGPDQAFRMLTQMSSDSNVKLRLLAERLVERAAGG